MSLESKGGGRVQRRSAKIAEFHLQELASAELAKEWPKRKVLRDLVPDDRKVLLFEFFCLIWCSLHTETKIHLSKNGISNICSVVLGDGIRPVHLHSWDSKRESSRSFSRGGL